MIRQRVKAGLAPVKARIARGEKFTSKAGIVRRNLGRPGAEPEKVERARQKRDAAGAGISQNKQMRCERRFPASMPRWGATMTNKYTTLSEITSGVVET